MRPALLLAVIWLGWPISWMVAALCSNRSKKRLVSWDVMFSFTEFSSFQV
jgi:hypothetical protein